MLHTNNKNQVILEVTTEDGYKLTPNYDHSAYVCDGLLWFPKLVFYNDFKQGHFDMEDGVHFTVTQTVNFDDYLDSRIPKVFSYGEDVYTYGKDDCYWNHDDLKKISFNIMMELVLEIQIESWACIPMFVENHPIIPAHSEWQNLWFANA